MLPGSWLSAAVSVAVAAILGAAAPATLHAQGAPLPGDAITYHYDNSRTGWAQSETILTAANVGSGNFGLLAQVPLDEQVDAQPLFLGNEMVGGQGPYDVVYAATENDTVYAIDANSGTVLLSNHLGTPVPITALPGQCNNNSNNMGINSTPVIDRAAGLMYVITYTYENAAPVFRLHALSLATLQDAMPSVVIGAKGEYQNGRPLPFAAANNRQRAALLETSGNIYAGFASWCDINADVSRGWIMGWNAATLAALPASTLLNRRVKSPNTFFLSSIWMSGYGIASDDNGSLYFTTGNSDFSGTTWNAVYNLSESVVRMSADLTTVQGYYTPDGGVNGWRNLDETDSDFGAAGVMLLPPQAGAVPNLAVAGGKVGYLYLMNRDALPGLNTVRAPLGHYVNDGCWCGPSYFVGADGIGRVVESSGHTLRLFNVVTSPSANPSLHLTASWAGIAGNQDPGFFTSISSNGTQPGSAVIWAIGRPTSLNPATVTLYAFDPTNSTGPIFTAAAGTWPFGGTANADLVPVVAKGHVFVTSYGNLSIFGLTTGNARRVVFKAPPQPQMIADRASPHALHGVVTALAGTTLSLQLRTGTIVKVDFTAAETAFHVAVPVVGNASLVRGAYDADGVFVASYVLHQKRDPAMWPADQ